MLAWHYAIDGYAGILGALACWWLAGRLTGPSHADPAVASTEVIPATASAA